MAIYDAGTASLAADGTVTGVGTTWRQPLTLIRVGATMIFNTSPISIVTIAEILSDTSIRAFNDKGFIAPAGTQYFILAHDGITVQGLAQDVAETLRYYQSQETSVASLVQLAQSGDFDFDRLQTLINEAKSSETNAASSASAALVSQQAAATSQTQAASSASSAQTAYNNTVNAIANAGDASTLVTLAGYGIASSGSALLGSLDWQQFDFRSGASYRINLANMTNTPAGFKFVTANPLLFINVIGLDGGNSIRLTVTTAVDVPSGLNHRNYDVYISSSKGSRVFVVRESISIQYTSSSDSAPATASASRYRSLIDVYSKAESDAVRAIAKGGTGATTASQARTNLDVYSKPEVNALLTQVDIKKDFGAVGDGVTDDTQALLAAVEASRNNAIAIHIPKGNYLTSQPLNFLRPATIIGEKGARISLTSGPHDYVIQMDHRDVNLDYWAYNSYMSNIIVDGNGYASDGFSLRGVISSYFDNLMATNIRRAGLHCWWTQLCVHNNFVCSGNVETFTTTPTYGILIDAEAGAVNFRGTSADLFINPTCEHVTESGIEATFCSNTTFIGGTSEGNKYGFSFGHESDLGITAVTNTVIGCDLEVNSGGDVVLRKTATGNLFNGLQSGFESPSIQVNGARANRFVGGSASGFDFYNGASGNHVEGTILFGQNAAVIDNSKLNSWEALYNINTGLYTDSSNPVQKRVQLSGGSILFNPLRTSLATVVIDSSPVVIDVQDNARDAQRMDFIIYNLSGGASPSVSFSNKFRVGSFTPPSAGRQIGMSFVYDANFAHWTCVGISPEGPIY